MLEILVYGGVVDWIHLAEDRQVVALCEKGNELSSSIEFGEFLVLLSNC
jgi:hypothetical protein